MQEFPPQEKQLDRAHSTPRRFPPPPAALQHVFPSHGIGRRLLLTTPNFTRPAVLLEHAISPQDELRPPHITRGVGFDNFQERILVLEASARTRPLESAEMPSQSISGMPPRATMGSNPHENAETPSGSSARDDFFKLC